MSAERLKSRRYLHVFLTIGLLAAGFLGIAALTASKPELEKQQRVTPAPAVRVVEVRTGPQTIHVFGEGTVKPLREVNLVPQVNGKVIETSPSLVNGGQFKQGDVLLKIDPVDYTLAVTLARAQVRDSESKLKLAKEETEAAKEEWRVYRGAGDRKPPPLVVKEPQLAAAQAYYEASRADLKKAQLALERTELKAPFDGRVVSESVGVGQYVAPGQVLAAIFSTEAAEIVVPFEDSALSWFHVPGFTPGQGPGSPAVISARFAGQDMEWAGVVVRAEGRLDSRTRMIKVIVRVEDPYVTRPPLAAGLFVTVDIHGVTLPEAGLIPRAALRSEDQVWVVDDQGILTFRTVEVARFQRDEVLLKSGLSNGEKVAISNLKSVTDGMKVRPALVTPGESS